jgi:hypothetical protein
MIMKRMVHAIVGTLALVLVSAFLIITIYAELTMDKALIADTKRLILYGLCLLVPAMAVTGGSGFSLAKGRIGGIVDAKLKRMRIIAANGLLILLPSAIWLHMLASQGNFGTTFIIVQIVEISAGIFQLYLIGRNLRDGLKLSGRLRRKAPRKTKTAGWAGGGNL